MMILSVEVVATLCYRATWCGANARYSYCRLWWYFNRSYNISHTINTYRSYLSISDTLCSPCYQKMYTDNSFESPSVLAWLPLVATMFFHFFDLLIYSLPFQNFPFFWDGRSSVHKKSGQISSPSCSWTERLIVSYIFFNNYSQSTQTSMITKILNIFTGKASKKKSF